MPDQRVAFLRDAQNKAQELFKEIEQDILRPGVSEKKLSNEIHQLGEARFGIKTHWHKRVVRSGPNTLLPFAENPPDRIVESDDILYVDLGPVFEDWEADFGRTYVFGNDPQKIRLRDALEPAWTEIKTYFDKRPDIMACELYAFACKVAENRGYQFGAHLAGHIIGCFPHERIPNDKTSLYVVEENTDLMSAPDKYGNKHHWILEVHLKDKNGKYSGFFEQLLTI